MIAFGKMGLGLMGLLTPGLTASLLGLSAAATRSGEASSLTASDDTTLVMRWFAVRELVNGLLLQDTSYPTLLRVLQYSVLIDSIDTISTVLGYYSQSLPHTPILALLAGPMVGRSLLF
ncbi:BQ2448_2022 [Microbotryum intermedium]|uniref:BQ2448_2022 protein n=1 Tax=Microbotryum intermedium TaxID=269621 RepID=A0A238F4Z4_9BASI|nr:BQ2448_2022 [Microbotryum intermedium]